MTPYRPPYPVPGVIWASLPLPALLIDPADRIFEVNPQGEIFLNASMRNLVGQPLLDRLHIDAPREVLVLRMCGRCMKTKPECSCEVQDGIGNDRHYSRGRRVRER